METGLLMESCEKKYNQQAYWSPVESFAHLGTMESPGGGFKVFQEGLLSTTVINYQIKAIGLLWVRRNVLRHVLLKFSPVESPYVVVPMIW